MLASLGLRWWQHIVVRGLHERYVVTELIFFFRKIILNFQIQLRPSNPTIASVLCRRRFPTKIAFNIAINRAQMQKPKRAEIYPPSPVYPMDSSMWNFLDPLPLKASLLRMLKTVDSVYKLLTDIIIFCISRSALKFQINKRILFIYSMVQSPS